MDDILDNNSNSIPEYLYCMYPQPFIVCGLQLKPFSVGHYCLLYRHKSPFVDIEESTAGAFDLIFLLYVCTHTYDEAVELSYDPDDILQWGDDLLGFITKKLEEEKSDLVFNIVEEIIKAKEYIKYHYKTPLYFNVESNMPAIEQKPDIFWIQTLLQTLPAECGYTDRKEVLNAPLGQALYDGNLYQHRNGNIRIASKEEKELIEQANK